MNTPPLLMLAALLFWGWRTDLMLAGALAGAVLESSRQVPLRWDFSAKDLQRIWDLCVILFIGAVVFTVFSQDLKNPTFALAQWLPLLFLPLMLAQAFGHLDRMPRSTFFLLLRSTRRHGPEPPGLNVSYPYFALCLFSASATNRYREWFLVGLGPLLFWAIWPHRSRRFTIRTWVGLFAGVSLLAFASATSLSVLQTQLEGRISEWITRFVSEDDNPMESRTAIGHIGDLKLSGRIVLRVEATNAPPDLLRKASYDSFRNLTWSTFPRKEMVELGAESEDGYWKLIPGKLPRESVVIAGYLRKGRGLIALPSGTAELDQLPVAQLKTNLMGVVEGVGGPGLVRYLARYGPGASLDGPVNDADLAIPTEERDAVAQVAQELGLPEAASQPAVVARRLTAFFQDKFRYATYLKGRHRDTTSPLSHFLLQQREGHCEYFASATVLLLRQAGIPARYATGYSVQEQAGNHRFVVRERHAHAWAIYFDRTVGFWRDLDTTPASWEGIEADGASWLEPIRDFFSRGWFEFSKWRWLADRAAMQRYLIWLLFPLAAILAWRLVTAKRRGHKAGASGGATFSHSWPGLDSEFFLVERRLTSLGFGREAGETFTDWIARLGVNSLCPVPSASLNTLLNLHYRHRFDPIGLNATDRTELGDGARRCLEAADAAKRTV